MNGSAAGADFKAILDALDCRGLAPSTAQGARIDDCEDPVALERWFDAALVARSCDEVFEASARS